MERLATAELVAPEGENVPPDIRSFTLDNGLTVIVWPDHDIPNVVLYNFVRAGGRNEYPGITGLSHFFEHMMFNGTSTRAPGEFDRIMEASGGCEQRLYEPGRHGVHGLVPEAARWRRSSSSKATGWQTWHSIPR